MEQQSPPTVEQAWRVLGRQLAASRHAAGVSQVQLAELTAHSRSTIANAETGRPGICSPSCTRIWPSTRPAWQAQDRALEICRPGDCTGWALIRLDRAACLAHDGDPGSGVAYAAETLAGLRADQSAGIIALRGRQVVQALPDGYQNKAAVKELRALMPGSAQEDGW